jgi:DNA-binding protein H-NS
MATKSLKSIEAQIRKLQQQAQTLKEKDRRPAIAQIVKLMKSHDISVEELTAALGKPGKTRKAPASKSASGPRQRKPVPVKYRHPGTGDTWTGRGRSPRWIVEAEKSGVDRSTYAVSAAA